MVDGLAGLEWDDVDDVVFGGQDNDVLRGDDGDADLVAALLQGDDGEDSAEDRSEAATSTICCPVRAAMKIFAGPAAT